MTKMLHKEYSLLFKKTLKCLNTYSSIQTSPLQLNNFEFSLVDIQIMSALYPNKENQYNMITIASELGIAPSTFSKSVSKLTKLGLMEKYHKKSNKKNVIVWLSPKGESYFNEIIKLYENPLNDMIKNLNNDPLREKYYLEFLETLENYLCPKNNKSNTGEQLIPIKSKD